MATDARIAAGLADTATAREDASPGHGAKVRLPVVDRLTTDVDTYRASAAGVTLDMVRGGQDKQPSRMRAVRSDCGITLSEARPGCKTISRTHLDGNCMAASYVIDAPLGTTWCGELQMSSGMGVIHHPDTEHTAINLPGARFVFAIADVDALVERSEVLEVSMQPWCRGQVDLIDGRAMAATPVLAHFASVAVGSVPARLLDDLLTAVSLSLLDPVLDRSLPVTAAVDSRQVVGDCIEFAKSIGREPSISEMCLVAHVGARRLRQAFHDVCGESPKRFFRHWVLCQAHDLLVDATPDETSVTGVATELGVTHLGRFSAQYRQLHGELPSQTLRKDAFAGHPAR